MADKKEVLEMRLDAEPKVKREPVNYLWTALNWDFLRLLAEIAQYAAGKYGSAEQYTNARLEGEKSPLNHAIEHLTNYMAGVPHDRFGTLDHQLAAAAYNIMMEYFDLKARGFRGFIILALQRAGGVGGEPLKPKGAAAVRAETAAIIEEQSGLVADWPEGLLHFRQRWQDGLQGAREPKAIAKWQAMLWVIEQFEGVQLTDDVVLPMLDDLKAAVHEKLLALSTPENVYDCNAKLGAIDTLRVQIPQLFQKKAEAK